MRRALTIAAALAVVALTVRAAVGMAPGLDYFADASASIDALVRGDLDGFFASQPLMGSFSLLVRAPFVAAVFDGRLEDVYFAGAIPCLVAALALGIALGRIAADAGQPASVQGLIAGLAVVNPITFRALHWGHPEELLAGALCVGAVLAAVRDRQLLAGLLLGLALATKQWALIAVLPALLATSTRRMALLGIAAAVAAALTLPALIANLGGFEQVARSAAGHNSLGASTTPENLWWPLADRVEVTIVGERYMAPAWVGTVAHPLIVLAPIPLAVLLWLRPGRRRDDALGLLTLCLLLRCLLDQWNNDYYHLPFLLSLLAWETVRRPGVPRFTLAAAILLGLSFWPEQTRIFADSLASAPLRFALYVAWAVPFAAGVALALYRPTALEAARAEYHRRRGAAPRPAAVRDRADHGRRGEHAGQPAPARR